GCQRRRRHLLACRITAARRHQFHRVPQESEVAGYIEGATADILPPGARIAGTGRGVARDMSPAVQVGTAQDENAAAHGWSAPFIASRRFETCCRSVSRTPPVAAVAGQE